VLKVSLDATEVPLAPAHLNEYTGTYTLDQTRMRTILRDGDRLIARDGEADRLELVPIGKDLFEVRANQARYQFQRERGRIVAVEMQPRILQADRARRTNLKKFP
jgi:hypothetical protein